MACSRALGAESVRIVSWNVHRCIGTDRRYRPERVAGVLRELDADVIALQEIDSSLKAAGGIDQLSAIAAEVGMISVLGPTLSFDYGAYGNAFLTRHRFLYWDEYDLSYRRFEPRGAIAVGLELSLPGEHRERVRLVGTHLGLKSWERAFQIDRLLSGIVWRSEETTLLLGDLNEWFPWSGNNLRLERSFKKARRLATFPSGWPRFSLDRILISGRAREFRREVVMTPDARVASDHLPLLVEFAFE